MAYQIYVTDPTQEIRSLLLALLRMKEEQSALEPGEQELLTRLRSLPANPPPRSPQPRVGTNGGKRGIPKE